MSLMSAKRDLCVGQETWPNLSMLYKTKTFMKVRKRGTSQVQFVLYALSWLCLLS